MARDEDPLVDLDELREVLRAHEGPPAPRRQEERSAHRAGSRRGRWAAVAIATIALLLGSGLGFGLGSSVTPSGSAGTEVPGLGFLPSSGWAVVQARDASATRAVAANVPLELNADLDEIPPDVLAALPGRGIVMQATFTTRGDPGEDFKFPRRELPLELDTASVVPVARGATAYDLRAALASYNVGLRVYFGSAAPTPAQLGAADEQLSRLVVVSEQVTIRAQPTFLRWAQAATVFGAVENGRADEIVTIEARDCGMKSFTGVAAMRTHDGGTWTTEFTRGINTTLRAVWNEAKSPPIALRQQPGLELAQRGSRRFEVGARNKGQLWRKRVILQRRVGSRWVPVRTVVLTEQDGFAGSGYVWTGAEFTASVPRRSQLRAVLPASQARPCYAATTSPVIVAG